jgi:hypothetical protein
MAGNKGLMMCVAALDALLVLVMVAQHAEASYFVVFSEAGCTSFLADLNACGCSNIPVGLQSVVNK